MYEIIKFRQMYIPIIQICIDMPYGLIYNAYMPICLYLKRYNVNAFNRIIEVYLICLEI